MSSKFKFEERTQAAQARYNLRTLERWLLACKDEEYSARVRRAIADLKILLDEVKDK